MADIHFKDLFNGVINCSSKPQINGISVEVGALSNEAKVGDEFIGKFQGCSDSEGEVPIQGASTSLSRNVTRADIENGSVDCFKEWNKIKLIGNGSVRYNYLINGVVENTASVVVRLVNSSGQSCDEVRTHN
jgi:hypothetical protein